MNKALTIYPKQEDWELCKQLGEYAGRGGILDIFKSALQIYIGREIGISTAAALNGLHIIEGKPSIAPKLAWAMIQNHPEFENYTENRLTDAQGDFYGWDITLKRKNGIQAIRRFTMDDARRITQGGKTLADKDNWRNYAEDMCYWRTQARVHSAVFPDVAMGMNRSDELGADITPDGDVIIDVTPKQKTIIKMTKQQEKDYLDDKIDIMPDGTIVHTQSPVSAPSVRSETVSEAPAVPQIKDYKKTLADLFKMTSQDEIIEAHNGESLPITPEQVNLTWHNLIQSSKIVETVVDLNETVENE